MLYPTTKWGQDGWRIFITVQFGSWDRTFVNEVQLCEESILVSNQKYIFEASLLQAIDVSSSTFVDRGHSVSITLKKQKLKHWPKLSRQDSHVRNGQLLIDWQRWTEKDDDVYAGEQDTLPISQEDLDAMAEKLPAELLPNENIQQELVKNIPFTPKDAEPLDSAPDLCVGHPNDTSVSRWISFWLDSMTLPQRMYTLVEIWNSLEQPDRQALVQYLIEVLAAESPEASEHVKGGTSVLRDLDASHYEDEKSCFCSQWVEQLKCFASSDKMAVVTLMFDKLSAFDKKLVISTFM